MIRLLSLDGSRRGTGLGNHVYNMSYFKPLESLPSDDKVIGTFAPDKDNHNNQLPACGAYGLTAKGNVILLDTFTGPAGKTIKKAPIVSLSVMIHDFIDKVIQPTECLNSKMDH